LALRKKLAVASLWAGKWQNSATDNSLLGAKKVVGGLIYSTRKEIQKNPGDSRVINLH
jgi:hypothetical protein